MRTLFAIYLLFACAAGAAAGEIIKFKLPDGETVDGKLSIPANVEKIRQLVIYVHGTGPATYDNHRRFGTFDFNYFDYFANEFNKRSIAFFSYNKRGVTLSETPPLFEKVDREKFRKVIPHTDAGDITTFINVLKQDRRLKKAKVILLGWSEGTVIAPLVATYPRNKVDALFLCGYVNENMWDLIQWQNSGASAMVTFRDVFDADKDGQISQAEYESQNKDAAEFRTKRLRDTKFEQFDLNKDKSLTAADFGVATASRVQAIRDAIARDDEDWIWNNYFHISTDWLLEHFALEPNKTRLPRLNLPIYIFHGMLDANCPVEGVLDIRRRFEQLGKKNLHEFIFKSHNHDLNFVDWVTNKEMPEGIRKIFDTASELNK